MVKSIHLRLADALDALMAARGLSNNELGKKAGVAPNTIANYRNRDEAFTSTGKPRSAKLAEIERIAAALDVDPIELLQGKVQEAPAPDEPLLPLSPLERQIVSSLRPLLEEDREEIARQVQAQADRARRLVEQAIRRPVRSFAADRHVDEALRCRTSASAQGHASA